MYFNHYSGLFSHKRTHTRINLRDVTREKKRNRKKHVELRTRHSTKGRKPFHKVISFIESGKTSEKNEWEMLFCDKCNERFKLLVDLNRHIQETGHY